MKTSFFKILTVAGSVALLGTACNKDLDRLPTNDITAEQVYSTPTGYKEAFAKVYGAYALTGNAGPAGNKDIQGSLDEGNFTDFLRTFWYTQELTTDEAVLAWGDPGLPDFHSMSWTPQNQPVTGLYYRAFYQITLANDFLSQSTADKVSSRGITGADASAIEAYRSEVRFLRAFQYWVLLDEYANPAFVTDSNAVGSILPPQIGRKDLFAYVEKELLDVQTTLPDARSNEYGRADKAAAWALLARLYLNAEVYTGTARWADAVTYSKKVIDAGYQLEPDYRQLYLADNNISATGGRNKEFILTINYDGLKTTSYGGTTFLTHASVGGDISAAGSGINGGWGGIRATKNLPLLFPDISGATDKRAEFAQGSQTLEIEKITEFKQGLGVLKYRNLKKDGTFGQSLDFADIDMALFRLPEMYLIYAEATVKGGGASGGDVATAVGYINKIRTRAYGNTDGNISAGDLTANFILDERARELYWEGFRRTDLIRYGRFTEGSYLWPWKGGVANGQGVPDIRKIFPIPSVELASNANLKQNPGY